MEEREHLKDLQERSGGEEHLQDLLQRAGKAKEKLPVLLEMKSVEERVPGFGRDQWRRGKSSRTCRRTGG